MSQQNKTNGKAEQAPELTIEELKEFKGFEGINDIEALDYIETIAMFSMIVFEIYNNVKSEVNE